MFDRHRQRLSFSKTTLFGILLILVGAGMLGFSAVRKALENRTLALSRAEIQTAVIEKSSPLALPTHIFIDHAINVDVEPLEITNGQWAVSDHEASYLVGSARPGEPGNSILYGHNLRSIFGNLRWLKGNEIIIVTTSDGKQHKYQVKMLTEVKPNNTFFLLPSQKEVLTLYTCSGFLDTQRFIVRAEPI